jgi:DNA-binding transcriptional regulator YdaS (Cro superfamily)
MLETIDDVIDMLGGTGKVAALVGLKPPAVSQWRARGRISSDKYFLIADALTRQGKTANPSLFGFAERAA